MGFSVVSTSGSTAFPRASTVLTALVEDRGRHLKSRIYELAAKLDEHLSPHAG